MKKLLSILLSAAMLTAATIIPASADENKVTVKMQIDNPVMTVNDCLLYTSDAADE